MTTYKSKPALVLIIPITVITGGLAILMWYEQIWIGLAFILLLLAFIAHMFLTTYYQVDNNTLRVKCGFFFDKLINIATIKEIKETNNPLSAPATSFDRLLLTYNRFDAVIISPKEKAAFISQLTGINPNIKLTLTTQKTNLNKY
jgi:energy-coupling factor transporter transmembrane protein EcfT